MEENIFSFISINRELVGRSHFLKRSKIKFILKYKFSILSDEQPIVISSANNVISDSFTSSQRLTTRAVKLSEIERTPRMHASDVDMKILKFTNTWNKAIILSTFPISKYSKLQN